MLSKCWVPVLAATLTAFAQQPATNLAAATPSSVSRSNVTTVETSPPAGYVIGATDVLRIDVWKEPELSGVVPVRPDGMISLPLLNDVRAAGLTPTELAGELSRRLARYVSDPVVTLVVANINSQKVFVLGEIARPGVLNLLPNMTVLQALSAAGTFSQFADRKNIYVLRSENGSARRYPFNYNAVVKGKRSDQNIALQPGDTIVVP